MPGFLDRRIDDRCGRRVDRLRAAGENDTLRCSRFDLGRGDRVGNDLGVDMRLTDASSNELRVLGAEIDDKNRVE